jgi:predicted dithiol-disulfide oxidoreductase (DUF899 family)
MTDYDQAREALRDAELALMQQREAVAALRRDLPQGPVAGEYVFEGSDGSVTLGELVGERPLVLYHFMFGGAMAEPCPMCSMWADGWNAVNDHVERTVDFALVTSGTADENVALAKGRGWTDLQWLSAADNSFKLDYGSGDADGNQWPFLTVFERDGDDVRLSYSGGAHIEGDHWRGVDLLSPVWHLLDLTRQGRGDFMPSLDYRS